MEKCSHRQIVSTEPFSEKLPRKLGDLGVRPMLWLWWLCWDVSSVQMCCQLSALVKEDCEPMAPGCALLGESYLCTGALSVVAHRAGRPQFISVVPSKLGSTFLKEMILVTLNQSCR